MWKPKVGKFCQEKILSVNLPHVFVNRNRDYLWNCVTCNYERMRRRCSQASPWARVWDTPLCRRSLSETGSRSLGLGSCPQQFSFVRVSLLAVRRKVRELVCAAHGPSQAVDAALGTDLGASAAGGLGKQVCLPGRCRLLAPVGPVRPVASGDGFRAKWPDLQFRPLAFSVSCGPRRLFLPQMGLWGVAGLKPTFQLAILKEEWIF